MKVSRIPLLLLVVFSGSIVTAQEPTTPPQKNKTNEQKPTPVGKKQSSTLDWGDWDKKFEPQQRYGVGIKGKLQSAISEMDKSNLISDSSGVKVSQSQSKIKTKKENSAINIKKMKAELKALEKKVEQEINNDIDY